MSGVDEALVEKAASALRWHLTERSYESGCVMACGYDGDEMDEHLARAVLEAVLPDLTAEHQRRLNALNEHADEIASQRNAAIRDADARVAAAEAERAEWERVAMKWTHRCSDERTRAEGAEKRLAAVLAGIEALAKEAQTRPTGPGHPIRNWIYVDDLRALASTDPGERNARQGPTPQESSGTALARVKAEAWDFGYSCGLGDYGKSDDETQSANPYRIDTGAGDS